MRFPKIIILLTVLAAVAIIALTHAGRAQVSTYLRIVAPANGQKISTDFVDVRFELINPSVTASEIYQLQIDDQAPVQTYSNSYTFTGLPAGSHTVVIEVVDANGTPVPGTMNAVQFEVLPPTPAPKPASRLGPAVATRSASTLAAPAEAHGPATSLPDAGGALPLLSVIGFGILLGGTASALKTR